MMTNAVEQAIGYARNRALDQALRDGRDAAAKLDKIMAELGSGRAPSGSDVRALAMTVADLAARGAEFEALDRAHGWTTRSADADR